MTVPNEQVVSFGAFSLDLHTLELRKEGVLVKLQNQPARVLVVLVEHAGELVSREALRRTIWNDDTFVDFDRGLNYCISQIRMALGDMAGSPQFLETLRGRGYRFRLPHESESPPLPLASSSHSMVRNVSLAAAAVLLVALGVWGGRYGRVERAIAVAPLTAPQGEQQWAAALHSQIVSRLSFRSRVPVIDLAASPSAGGNALWRVEGRVDRSAAQYRVTMRMRDARDGSVQWADVFAGPPGDWVDAQSEMADRMTEAIRYKIEGPSAGTPQRRSRLPPNRSMALAPRQAPADSLR